MTACGEPPPTAERPHSARGPDGPGREAAATASDRIARRHAAAALLIVGATIGAVVIPRALRRLAPSPSAAECARLVDRYLEQAARQRNPDARPEDIAQELEHAPGSSDHQRDVADCRRRLTRAQVICGLAAPNVDVLERCIQ